MASGPARLPIWGIAEIAAYYAVSKQLVYKWSQRSDFPKPYAVLAAGSVYLPGAVREWGRKHGRKMGGGPRSTTKETQ